MNIFFVLLKFVTVYIYAIYITLAMFSTKASEVEPLSKINIETYRRKVDGFNNNWHRNKAERTTDKGKDHA